MKFKHSLMSNNFTRSDMDQVKKFINRKNITLTQSKKVKEFEKNGLVGWVQNIQYLLIQDHLQIL